MFYKYASKEMFTLKGLELLFVFLFCLGKLYTLIYCRHFRTYCGAQCLIEVIRSSGEEMWCIDAYQIPYYSRGIEEAKQTHPRFADWMQDNIHCAPRISSKMATIDECIEFALKNIGLWWRYGVSRHCDEWKYIIIGRIFESEIRFYLVCLPYWIFVRLNLT
jgi:hypothetical protein